jgi:hypothetical protein
MISHVTIVTDICATMVCVYGATMVTMAHMKHIDSLIIDQLGGNTAVAKLFNVSSQAVSKWRNDGIPDARLMYLRLAYPDLFDTNQQQAA